jgi:hypothetical protein
MIWQKIGFSSQNFLRVKSLFLMGKIGGFLVVGKN